MNYILYYTVIRFLPIEEIYHNGRRYGEILLVQKSRCLYDTPSSLFNNLFKVSHC